MLRFVSATSQHFLTTARFYNSGSSNPSAVLATYLRHVC